MPNHAFSNFDTKLTKKARVAECLRELIKDNVYPVGSNLPDMKVLADNSPELFGIQVSQGTVRDGEQFLIDAGQLDQPRQGVPTKILEVPAKLHREWYSPKVREKNGIDAANVSVMEVQGEPVDFGTAKNWAITLHAMAQGLQDMARRLDVAAELIHPTNP